MSKRTRESYDRPMSSETEASGSAAVVDAWAMRDEVRLTDALYLALAERLDCPS